MTGKPQYSNAQLEEMSYEHLMSLLNKATTKRRARTILDVIAAKYGKLKRRSKKRRVGRPSKFVPFNFMKVLDEEETMK